MSEEVKTEEVDTGAKRKAPEKVKTEEVDTGAKRKAPEKGGNLNEGFTAVLIQVQCHLVTISTNTRMLYPHYTYLRGDFQKLSEVVIIVN